MRFRPLSGYMPFKLKAKEIIEKEEKRLSPIGVYDSYPTYDGLVCDRS